MNPMVTTALAAYITQKEGEQRTQKGRTWCIKEKEKYRTQRLTRSTRVVAPIRSGFRTSTGQASGRERAWKELGGQTKFGSASIPSTHAGRSQAPSPVPSHAPPHDSDSMRQSGDETQKSTITGIRPRCNTIQINSRSNKQLPRLPSDCSTWRKENHPFESRLLPSSSSCAPPKRRMQLEALLMPFIQHRIGISPADIGAMGNPCILTPVLQTILLSPLCCACSWAAFAGASPVRTAPAPETRQGNKLPKQVEEGGGTAWQCPGYDLGTSVLHLPSPAYTPSKQSLGVHLEIQSPRPR